MPVGGTWRCLRCGQSCPPCQIPPSCTQHWPKGEVLTPYNLQTTILDSPVTNINPYLNNIPLEVEIKREGVRKLQQYVERL